MSDLPCILSRIDMRQIWLSWLISSFYQFISLKSGGEEKGCSCQTRRNFPHVLCFLYFLQILIFDSSTESWNPGSMSQDDIKCMTNGQRVAWVKLNLTFSLKKAFEIYQKNHGFKAWCSIIFSKMKFCCHLYVITIRFLSRKYMKSKNLTVTVETKKFL